MKYLIVLFAANLVYCLAATVPHYERIATYRNAQLQTYKNYNKLQLPIVGGSYAAANQFPYQVAIAMPVGDDFVICGGSLISADWVLTACHCTKGFNQYNLRFGSLNFWNGGITMTSFIAINHPLYHPTYQNNDISLIRLPKSIGLGPSILPVNLPRISQINDNFVNTKSAVSGFGHFSAEQITSDVLRWVNMRIISNAECLEKYGPQVVLNHVICALGYTNPQTQGHCSGDSGGPLIMEENNNYKILIGVISFAASSGCQSGLPSGYMRTTHFLQWIAEHTQIPLRP